MPLTIYNSLTRRKEEFVPLTPGRVGMYVCGPTVYSHPHIGHAKSYVSFDVIVRYLRYLGNKVLYVQNITDVGHLTDDADEGEDRIEKQSKLDPDLPLLELFVVCEIQAVDIKSVRVRLPQEEIYRIRNPVESQRNPSAQVVGLKLKLDLFTG